MMLICTSQRCEHIGKDLVECSSEVTSVTDSARSEQYACLSKA